MENPQLLMRHANLAQVPLVTVPAGYTLRTFQPGDETQWDAIMKTAFNHPHSFAQEISAHEYYKPENVFFLCKDDIPVASAIAWSYDKEPETTGCLHMIGALPEHKGKGLGYQVTLAALRKMHADGKLQSVLTTDDFRLPAIHVYLELGFVPDLTGHESFTPRWEKLYQELGRPWTMGQ